MPFSLAGVVLIKVFNVIHYRSNSDLCRNVLPVSLLGKILIKAFNFRARFLILTSRTLGVLLPSLPGVVLIKAFSVRARF